jgi:hypothetical protein
MQMDVDSRVFTRMLRKDGRTDRSITISLRNFIGEGIKIPTKLEKHYYIKQAKAK